MSEKVTTAPLQRGNKTGERLLKYKGARSMKTNNNLITKEFEGQEIAFRTNEVTGVSEVRIDEVAKFCGWTRIETKKGIEYFSVIWHRVNKHLEELGFAHKCAKGDFIPEYVMYALIGKAKNENATKFMLWVGQVLVQLRTTGVVITETATEEAINFEIKYGTYRIRKTFTNSNNLKADYEEFKELAKENKLSGAERAKRTSIIFDAVNTRYLKELPNLKGSEMLLIQELLTDIARDKNKLDNKVNGGQKAGQTKLINQCKDYIQQQEEYINYYLPKQDEFNVINYHGFTENCIYGSTDEAGNLRFSKSYNIWRSKFPKYEIQIDETIDFSRPVHLYMYFDIMDKFDVSNMQKSFVDMLCLCYGVDDKYIQTTCMLNEYVEDYADGKIYYCLKQGEWEQ